MKKVGFLLMILFVCAGFQVLAQSLDLDATLPMDDEVITGTLPNGMTYYVKSNETPKNRAELKLVVNAGSILEDEDQLGLAHFTEHMAFNGTKNFPKHELINYLESIGMKFGPEVNAFTSFDQTVYGIKVPLDSVEYVDKGLLVLFDWAHNLLLEGEEIDKERGVIHEEWRMGQGAQDRMMREYLPKIFYNSHYAERLPIGKMDIVDNCSYDVLRRFYEDWYRPDLMAVIAVGDFDAKEMEQKIVDQFSKIPEKENPRERKMYDVPDHEETLVAVATDPESPMSSVQLYIKHPVNITKTVKDYRENIKTTLFSQMLSKRLSELTMKEDAPFIQGYAFYTNFLGPKSVFINLAIPKNNDFMTALEALVKENNRVKQHGFTATELEREKNALMKQVKKQYNERNKQKSGNISNELMSHYMYPHEPVPGMEYEYKLYKKYLPEISLEEVNAVAKKLITDKNTVIVIGGPEKEDVDVPTEEEVLNKYKEFQKIEVEAYVDEVIEKPLVEKTPAAGEIVVENYNKKMEYKELVFDNGVRVILKNTDFKDDEILFRAESFGGSSLYEQKDDVSVDIATAVSRESGLGEFDKIALSKMLSDKYVRLNPFINFTSEGLRGSCATEDMETMLKMAYLYFTDNRVTKEGFNTYMEKLRTELENKSLAPQSVWQDSIRAIMSNYHPMKRPLNMDMLDEVSYKRIKYIMENRFIDPANFTFYFVGNIDEEKHLPLIKQFLGGLPKVNREESYKDLGITPPEGVVEKMVYKGQDQKSMVVINFYGEMEYTMENRLELDAISKVLSTKLLEEIRENESGVYTIGAYPNASKYPKGKFSITIFFSCDPQRVDELTKGVFAEIEKLQQNGPTEVDLNKVIEKKRREHETNLRENKYWLSKLQEIQRGEISDKDFLKYDKYIDKLSAKDLQEAANTFFDKNEYVSVVLRPEKE